MSEETETKPVVPHVFVDLDGVLVDFEGGYEVSFGHKHNSVSEWMMWKNITSKEDHWETMPKMPNFDELWDHIKQFNPTVLTGCPRSGYKAAAEGKVKWCKEHLGESTPVITCYSRHKPKHMINPGDVLIDDMERNCERWREAGGIAILYDGTNTSEVIAKLAELGL